MRDAAASTTAGIEASDLVLHLHVTAFLELLGADPDRCDDQDIPQKPKPEMLKSLK